MNINTSEYWDKVWLKEDNRFYPHFNDIVNFIQNINAKSVIDLGCGTGTLLKKIKNVIPNAELFGIDISNEAIKKLVSSGLLGQVDKIETFISSRKYDVAILTEVLEHCDNENIIIEKAFEIADTVIITVPDERLGPEEESEHQREYSFKGLKELLQKSVRFVRVWPYNRTKHLLAIASKNENLIDKRKRVWISVLNEGEINTNLAQYLMDLKTMDDRYDVHLEFSAYKPIQHNRNYIVKKFLKTDYQYLIMLDDDMNPHWNILDFIEHDKDILGASAQAYQGHFPIWTPKDIGPEGKFMKLDLNKMYDEGFQGFLEVDGVGTGIIIIARRVLEAIKAPFNVKWYEDGTRENGLDYNFCLRAKEVGFKVWIHSQFISSHYQTVDLYQIDQNYRKYFEQGKV